MTPLDRLQQADTQRKRLHPLNCGTSEASERERNRHRRQGRAHLRPCSEHICMGPADGRLPSYPVFGNLMLKAGVDIRMANWPKPNFIQRHQKNYSDSIS